MPSGSEIHYYYFSPTGCISYASYATILATRGGFASILWRSMNERGGSTVFIRGTVDYRTLPIQFTPSSRNQWRIYTESRQEAARLWNDLVARHFRIRRAHWKWPSKGRWEKWAQKRYPKLHSQSVQQMIKEFLDAVNSTRQLRKKGYKDAKYPWRKYRYRDVIYTNQAAKIRDGFLTLPNGTAGTLRIKLPYSELPGRLMQVEVKYHKALLVFECAVRERQPEGEGEEAEIGADMGVNTLIAATDGETAICISGRAVKSDIRYRNKQLGKIQAAQSTKKKGSRRWKKLQKRKAKTLNKSSNRIADKIHKATRKIADAFPNAKVYVGEPFNDAAQKVDRIRAQNVSSAANRRIIEQLNYKLAGATEINEAYTSQTCPVCGERSKHRRTYRCPKCGLRAPRDVVGCLNIRTKGIHGSLLPGQSMPSKIIFKYPEKFSGRSPGHGASSSE